MLDKNVRRKTTYKQGATRALSVLTFSVSLLPFAAQAQPNLAPEQDAFALEADDLSYDQSTGNVKAEGNVNIVSEKGTLWADELNYNRETGDIIAEGNVIFVNQDKTTVFVDRLELNQDMKTGVIEKLRLRLGDQVGDPVLVAKRAEKLDDANMTLINAAYSPCLTCDDKDDDHLPWKIRAGKITYNSEKRHITYKNAVLDIYGTPILYFPYFRHPAGEQVAQSGLLPPRFGKSTNRGEEVNLGYYIHHSDQADTTLRARIMSKRGTQFHYENRYEGTNLSHEIRSSIITDQGNSNALRSHAKINSAYTFQPGTRAGLSGTITSDDTYMDDFFGDTDAYHAMTAYGESGGRDHYYSATATWYQDLDENSDPGLTAQAVPRFILDRTFDLNKRGRTVNLLAEGMTVYRGEGRRVNRLVSQVTFTQPWVTSIGHMFKASASMRGDVYHIDNNGSDNEGFELRALPQLALSWERPMVSPGGTHRMTPKAMFVWSPQGGNKSDIPNEDSVSYELDTTNLFDTNRFSGYDRVENGPRFMVGVDNHWGEPGNARWRVFLGQSFRFTDDNTLPNQGGTASKVSDWVGYLEGHPLSWLAFNSSFRLDNADWEARRMDTSITLGNESNNFLNFGHSLLDGGPQEINASAQLEVTDNITLRSALRRDLKDGGKLLESEGGIIYTQQCYKLSFTARRRGFENRNVPPSTDYLFNIELLTLGRDRD